MPLIVSESIAELLELRGYTPNAVEDRKLKSLDLQVRKNTLTVADIMAFVRKKDKNFWKYLKPEDYRELENLDI